MHGPLLATGGPLLATEARRRCMEALDLPTNRLLLLGSPEMCLSKWSFQLADPPPKSDFHQALLALILGPIIQASLRQRVHMCRSPLEDRLVLTCRWAMADSPAAAPDQPPHALLQIPPSVLPGVRASEHPGSVSDFSIHPSLSEPLLSGWTGSWGPIY